MDILIVFKDGTQRIIRNAKDGKRNEGDDLFRIEKDGLTALVAREEVRYFGPKEFWMPDK